MNSKRKGSAGEREIVDLLQKYGIRAYRNDQIFKSGKENPDVSADLAGIQIHIEVKRVEKLNVSAAISQAKKDASEKSIPVVVHRRNREQWLLTIPLITLLELLKEKEVIFQEEEPDSFYHDLLMEQGEQM